MPSHVPTLLSLAVLAVSGAAGPAHAGPTLDYERQAVAEVNVVRQEHGLRALRRTGCLARFADAQARRMAQRRQMFHQDLTGVLRTCDLRRAAENVAVGYGTGSAAVRAGWMQSPAHRTNVLTRGHRLTAVGAYRDDLGLWWTVQLFGRR